MTNYEDPHRLAFERPHTPLPNLEVKSEERKRRTIAQYVRGIIGIILPPLDPVTDQKRIFSRDTKSFYDIKEHASGRVSKRRRGSIWVPSAEGQRFMFRDTPLHRDFITANQELIDPLVEASPPADATLVADDLERPISSDTSAARPERSTEI